MFNPYRTQEMINKQLGIDFEDPSGLDKRNDINLLVFVQNDKVVKYTEISRSYAYSSLEETNLIIQRGE